MILILIILAYVAWLIWYFMQEPWKDLDFFAFVSCLFIGPFIAIGIIIWKNFLKIREAHKKWKTRGKIKGKEFGF